MGPLVGLHFIEGLRNSFQSGNNRKQETLAAGAGKVAKASDASANIGEARDRDSNTEHAIQHVNEKARFLRQLNVS